MADPSRYPGSVVDTTGNTGVGSDRGSNTGTPRWVKVFVMVAVIAVLLFVILQIVSGGDHGPGRHVGNAGDQAPLAQRP